MTEMSEAEVALLREVKADQVAFSRQRYFMMRPGQPDAPQEIFSLRARGLVRLRRARPGERIPPTQLVETTDRGDALLQELSDANA